MDLTDIPLEVREIIFDKYISTLKARAYRLVDVIDHAGFFMDLTLRSEHRREFLIRRRELLAAILHMQDISSLVRLSANAKTFARFLQKIENSYLRDYQKSALELFILLLNAFVIHIQTPNIDLIPPKELLTHFTCREVQDITFKILSLSILT